MKHLYGIVPTSSGIEADPGIVGVYGFPVHTMTHNGVTAIVSDSHNNDYTGLSKSALVRVLADHQRVTETLMPHASVILPVKFGTLLTPAGVQTLLAQSCADFETVFETLTGKVEVEVVATWQFERVLAEIAQEPTVVQLRAAAEGRTPAEVKQIQIVLGQIVAAGLEERKAAYQQQILDSLSDIVDDTEINLSLNEQVVANLAFLLPTARQAEFDQMIEALDARLDGQLNFKIVDLCPPTASAQWKLSRSTRRMWPRRKNCWGLATRPQRTKFAPHFYVRPVKFTPTPPRTTQRRRSSSPISTKPISFYVTAMRFNIRR